MLPLAFTSPFMLLALVALPALWFLLRLVPPRPQQVAFPPLALLAGLLREEETPARTPWWLTALRLLLAALVVLLLAGPVWRPGPAHTAGTGPLVLLIDNGWGAARDWDARLGVLNARLAEAEGAGRPVALVATAEAPDDVTLLDAGGARRRVAALLPEPWTADRTRVLPKLAVFLREHADAQLVWVSDGVAVDPAAPFLDGLRAALGSRTAEIVEADDRGPLALAGAENAPDALTVRVLRAGTTGAAEGSVRALDQRGLPLGEAPFRLAAGAAEATARFDLPVELRNSVARLDVSGERSAGAVQLLDDRWRRRTLGIVSGENADEAQPLLSAAYYLTRAVQPFADLHVATGASPSETVGRFIDDRLPVIMLADVGTLGPSGERLAAWVENGGVLVRFAGQHLAAAGDALVPVPLRGGGRTLGGALSWERPQPLGSFSADGPFAGLPVPTDVTVTRQVLADPGPELAGHVWAQLADGTPLVTAARRGRGLVVLFHVTADTTWSNLPLSGSFVEMLRRVVGQAGSVGPASSAAAGAAAAPSGAGRQAGMPVPPTRLLDGFGAFRAPPPTAQPVRSGPQAPAGPEHPPGFYGPADAVVAVNTLAPKASLARLAYGPLAGSVSGLAVTPSVPMGAPLLVLALVLLLADTLIVWAMAGGPARLRRVAPRGAGSAAALLLAILMTLGAPPLPAHAQGRGLEGLGTPGSAQGPDTQDTGGDGTLTRPFDATLRMHLAYVVTGDKDTDDTSRAGLRGLTAFLTERTALEPGEPIGIDVAKDELAFDQFLYWPIVPGAASPPPAAMAKVDAFMKSGGLVVFDTRDALESGTGAGPTPAGETLQRLLAGLDIPELEPVPRNHVLTKTFFLMESFPGRTDSGQTWVAASDPDTGADDAVRPAAQGDGVTPLIITGNDLAAAWAVGPDMQPLFPLTPGGERQRELAYRGGVNIVMYALTGNYKSDQVHVPALLERLGQ